MSWSVYKHVASNNKVYVGITSNIKNRWAGNGYYYHLSDTIFSRALKKYGWDSFEHVVLYTNLSKEEAVAKEIELIKYYKSINMSYNTTDGGEGYSGKHSEEHIKNRVRSRINNSAYDYILIDKYYNYIVCDSIREIADYLEVTPGVVRHVMHQPIGYSCKKHFIWKHLKTDPIYIEDIKNQIEKALLLRKMKFVETINKYRPVYQEVIKAKIALMTPEERKTMFGRRRKKEN
jgi:predicted GIY-YIG superfamily endonuclease